MMVEKENFSLITNRNYPFGECVSFFGAAFSHSKLVSIYLCERLRFASSQLTFAFTFYCFFSGVCLEPMFAHDLTKQYENYCVGSGQARNMRFRHFSRHRRRQIECQENDFVSIMNGIHIFHFAIHIDSHHFRLNIMIVTFTFSCLTILISDHLCDQIKRQN